MRIVIIGAGKVGYSLARMLSAEEHDVIVVEPEIERGNIINEKLDVQVVNGNGASPRLQRAIDIGNADLVIAVTDRDEINMLSCMFAKLAGAKRTVARLRDIDYANDIAALQENMPQVDVFINPEQVTAEAISNYIRIPEAKNIYYFDKRKLMMVELPVSEQSTINGKALKDLPKMKPFLITAVLRDGKFIIPNGNEIIRANDFIFLMTKTSDMKEIERSLGFKRKVIQKVMILGGGRLGYYLAKILEPMDVQVKIIEQNLKRCEFLSGMLDTTIVLNGDVGDADILAEEGISNVDILVASTDNDKLNILACLLGAQLGAKQTVTQIRRTDYMPLIQSVGIDVAVDPQALTREAILKLIRKGKLESLTLIDSGSAEVIDLIVKKEHRKICGCKVKNIPFPSGVIISSIDRDNDVIIPNGEDVIMAGDRITIFVGKKAVRKVEKLINI